MSEGNKKSSKAWCWLYSREVLLFCIAVLALFALLKGGTLWHLQHAGATTATNTYSTVEQQHFLPAPEAPPSQTSNAHTPAELVAEIKEAISDKQQSALTGLSNIVSQHATVIAGLSTIFLAILGGTIWQTLRVRASLEEDLSEIDGQLKAVNEKLDSVDMLARYASIMTIYGASKRTASVPSANRTENIQASEIQPFFEKLLDHQSAFSNQRTNTPDEFWANHGQLLRNTIFEVLHDKTEPALKAGQELYKLFESLPKKEICTTQQANAQTYFVQFFAQKARFDDALQTLGAIKTTFKGQTEPIARALAFLVQGYAIDGQLDKGQKTYEEIKKLGNEITIIEALSLCAPYLLFFYALAAPQEEYPDKINQLFQETQKAYNTNPQNQFITNNFAGALLGMTHFYSAPYNSEGAFTIYELLKELKGSNNIQDFQSEAYKNIIYIFTAGYPKSNITKARTILDAMKGLGDTERRRDNRATASACMINLYALAGNTKEARALFDEMKDLGDREEILTQRAQATVIIIEAYDKEGNMEEAQKMFDELLLLGEFPERQKTIARAGAKLIEAYAKAKNPKEDYGTAALIVYSSIKGIEVESEALEWKQEAEEAMKKKGWI